MFLIQQTSNYRKILHKLVTFFGITLAVVASTVLLALPGVVYADNTIPELDPTSPYYEGEPEPTGDVSAGFGLSEDAPYSCGSGDDEIKTSIDFGCDKADYQNGIMDLAMAILRQLVNAVGIVLMAIAVFAGIQYGASRGDPNMVTAAKKRLFNVFVSLFIFLLSFTIINYLVPGFFS